MKAIIVRGALSSGGKALSLISEDHSRDKKAFSQSERSLSG
jgi:hypothetical protein